MKNINKLILLIYALSSSAFAQSKDTLTFESQNFKVFENKISHQKFVVDQKGNTIYDSLKFAEPLNHSSLQVIDQNNKMFYLDYDLTQTDSIDHSIRVCGNVPHYNFTVFNKENNFIIVEHTDLRYVGEGESSKEITISKSEADSVYFINLEHEFSFSANYGAGLMTKSDPYPSPRTIIIKKDGKFKIRGSSENKLFDDISNVNDLLKIRTNNLVGYYGINTQPKYKTIGKLNQYLTRFELPNGKSGYFDLMGMEYFD